MHLLEIKSLASWTKDLTFDYCFVRCQVAGESTEYGAGSPRVDQSRSSASLRFILEIKQLEKNLLEAHHYELYRLERQECLGPSSPLLLVETSSLSYQVKTDQTPYGLSFYESLYLYKKIRQDDSRQEDSD